MRLQRPDRTCDILQPRVKVVDLLPGAVLVESPGLRALLALLAKLLDGDPILGGRALVVLEQLLFATLPAEYLADGLTELVDLILQGRSGALRPAAARRPDARPLDPPGVVHCSANYSSCPVLRSTVAGPECVSQ